jgi:hypothetical protein
MRMQLYRMMLEYGKRGSGELRQERLFLEICLVERIYIHGYSIISR